MRHCHTFARLLALALGCIAGAAPIAGAQVTVRTENPLAIERHDETLAIPWPALRRALPSLAPGRARVVEIESGREIVSQVVDADADGTPDELLFQASFRPGEVRVFAVEAAAPTVAAVPRAHVKFVPERTDVAWENDRIAFRTYGQLLWQLENLHSSGIDVWVKRTRALVLDRWYAAGHDAYHLDTGEGADFYKVGPTLGTGGTAIWRSDTLHRSENFAKHRIIADGPIRAIFELEFDPWDVGGLRVTEMKRISIDAGQNLYRSESTFRTEGASPAQITYAIGTVKRPGLIGSMSAARTWAFSSTWGPVENKPGEGGHGDLGSAVLLERSRLVDVKETGDHFVALATAQPGVPVVHYVGAAWTGSRDFDGVESWWAHLDAFAQRLEKPVTVTLLRDGRAITQAR